MCSDETSGSHQIEPLRLAVSAKVAWKALEALLSGRPRTRIVTSLPDYMYVECRTRWIGFIDDLEFHLRAEAAVIAVRSASRIGYSDLGLNRKRVEELRASLRLRGLVE